MSHRVAFAAPLHPRRLFWLLASAVLVAVLLAPRAQAQDKVTFLTNWFAQAEHGGFYAGVTNGIYKKHGLDVTVRMGGPQVNVMQLLAAGQVDFVMGYDFWVMKAIEQGVPAVTVGVSFQKDLACLATHVEVKSLDELKGKTVFVATASRSSWWPWLRTKYGLADDQVRPFTGNLQPFLADKNSATQGFITNSPFDIEKAGFKANYFLFADYGWPVYGSTIVTMQKQVKDRPDLVARFVRASMEGWKQYLADPSAANALIKQENPRANDDQLAYALARLKELKALTGGDAERLGIGTMNEARYKAIYELMVREGLLKPEIDHRQAFTTQFVKDLRVMP
jgi:NitT/TauT family transport system substrate-binding protein